MTQPSGGIHRSNLAEIAAGVIPGHGDAPAVAAGASVRLPGVRESGRGGARELATRALRADLPDVAEGLDDPLV